MGVILLVNFCLLFIFKGNKILRLLLHWNLSHKDVTFYVSYFVRESLFKKTSKRKKILRKRC